MAHIFRTYLPKNNHNITFFGNNINCRRYIRRYYCEQCALRCVHWDEIQDLNDLDLENKARKVKTKSKVACKTKKTEHNQEIQSSKNSKTNVIFLYLPLSIGCFFGICF